MKQARWIHVAGIIGCAACSAAPEGAEGENARGERAATPSVSARSHGLPPSDGPFFSVTPTLDLVDGQVVDIVLDHFTPNTPLVIAQCPSDGTSTDCSANAISASTDATGLFTGTFPVFREYDAINSRRVSCVEDFSCNLSVAVFPSLTPVFRRALTFADGAPFTGTISVTPDTGVAGDVVQVVGAGWTPGARVEVTACTPGAPLTSCRAAGVLVGEDGSFDTVVQLVPSVGVGGALVDCTAAPGACVILARDPRHPLTNVVEVPITVQALPAPRGRVKAKVKLHATGVVANVRGSGWAPDRDISLLLCTSADFAHCGGYTVRTDNRGSFRVCEEFTNTQDFPCEAGGCSLIVADPNALTATAVVIPISNGVQSRVTSCD